MKWLIIESDKNDTNGFFLYYHMDDKTGHDTWHKTIDDAFEAVCMRYGAKENWNPLSAI